MPSFYIKLEKANFKLDLADVLLDFEHNAFESDVFKEIFESWCGNNPYRKMMVDAYIRAVEDSHEETPFFESSDQETFYLNLRNTQLYKMEPKVFQYMTRCFATQSPWSKLFLESFIDICDRTRDVNILLNLDYL